MTDEFLVAAPSILFQGIPTPQILNRKPTKLPTNKLSSYVLNELPKDIEAWDSRAISLEGLAARQISLLGAERDRLQTLKGDDEAAIAQLDLLMLLGAYLPAKEAAYELAPAPLLEYLALISARHQLPPRLTYELIVDVNTSAFLRSGGNIRTFSRGQTARVERDFYIGHHFAERHIRESYELLRSVLENPAMPDRRAHLQATLDGLVRFTEYMAAYGRLPADSYAYFRRFLVPYPDKTKNASGAFMPTPQLFEMLLHPPGFAQTEYLRRNLQYFSRWAQEELRTQIEAPGVTVQSRLKDGSLRLDTDESEIVDAIIEQFVRFKLVHIRVASSKIPEAFPKRPITEREDLRTFQPKLDAKRDGAGSQQGTGGFAPQDFLGDGVRRLLDLQAQLRRSE